MGIPGPLDTLTSGLSSIARLPAGTTVRPNTKKLDSDKSSYMPRLVKLYDVENNAQCRMVRECITELDLVVENVIPSGKKSNVWKEDLEEFQIDGKNLVLPRLVAMEKSSPDVETHDVTRVLQGVDDIIEYLEQHFSDPIPVNETVVETSSAIVPVPKDDDFLTRLVPEWRSYVASFLRLGRGSSVTSAAISTTSQGSLLQKKRKPLILYSYEGNQFCRLVREVLTELDVAYELRSAGKSSPRRAELASISGGSTQCPYLIDPNTDTQMAESKDIIAYLYREYADWVPPSDALRIASAIVTPLLKPVYKQLAPLQAGKEYDVEAVQKQVKEDIKSAPVVVYTYTLSPFCAEATTLLKRLDVPFKEICLGWEWIPLLIRPGGAETRAELGRLTGQTSLPHIFIGGESLGGLYSGNPGLVPSLESRQFFKKIEAAKGPLPELKAEKVKTVEKVEKVGTKMTLEAQTQEEQQKMTESNKNAEPWKKVDFKNQAVPKTVFESKTQVTPRKGLGARKK